MIDLCTVVFEPEVDILHLQARSIDRYVTDIGTIYVVVNDHTPLNKIDVDQWGRHRSRVQVLPRRLFGSTWSDNGWVSQQCIKLVTAAISSADHCVALDAKTIVIKSWPQFHSGQQLAVGTLPVYPVFEPSRQRINQLWNIDLQRQLGPGGVPFWFVPRLVRGMISDIEHRVNRNFANWFQNQGCITEFLLYSGWLEYQGLIDTMIAPSQLQVVNVCHSDLDIVDQKLDQMPSSHTVSIHRDAWTRLTVDQRRRYLTLLEQRL